MRNGILARHLKFYNIMDSDVFQIKLLIIVSMYGMNATRI